MTDPRTTVSTAVSRLFGEKDASAIDDFFGPVYVQHSALGVDGLPGIRGLLAGLPDGFRYELVRVLADGDLVVTHGLYYGYGAAPVVGFDVWRVEGDRIVEHWDALAPSVGDATAAVDGPVAPSSSDAEASRGLALAHLGAGRAAVAVEHTPALAIAGPYAVDAVHTVIADGDFVFTRSEGRAAEAKAILNDLWRVEGDAVVEHWTLIAPVPATLPHDNGVF
ncbi:putative SnoaL-like aldol condensation-catalyzing enzyme [Microbacteriaceae bacterium SG_E_30_P1]|uniref:SnoaL-like aldol condensation-catalyzing enzyme n=1 Tax=Antiquaquibacter oligotrophicus TaxID=2880260 RepID=A0ABT6KRF4_9MICO|nr:nuclear transport factor 2 family protein [Antiquaquibacter oligotrophicus]MDH6182564.1 putative SnoaL-like aldol condensation-catalyzing enzyme [Antiquaquibacter oligotrophicus]UDF14469.1 nuclear transport factor 2 family protein [Antiquaquibacter oligotrophicus]